MAEIMPVDNEETAGENNSVLSPIHVEDSGRKARERAVVGLDTLDSEEIYVSVTQSDGNDGVDVKNEANNVQVQIVSFSVGFDDLFEK